MTFEGTISELAAPNGAPSGLPDSDSAQTGAHIIVIGNEKGGAGKSTVAMHLTIALMKMGRRVGVLDLDVRQRSFSRYLENRARWRDATGTALQTPNSLRLDPSPARNLDQAEAEEAEHFAQSIAELKKISDFIVVDSPGGDTFLSRLAHETADSLITPLNDSWVDFDLLGDIHPQTLDVVRPSFYSEMVWNARRQKMRSTKRQIDWVVMRNRMSPLDTRNKQRVGDSLRNLSQRIGFRIAPGLSERVIYRELFPMGLTLLDVAEDPAGPALTMSHIAARQEVRDLLIVLKLPGFEGEAIRF